MLPRSLRLLRDGGDGTGVTLSAFRSRVPESERGAPALEPVSVRGEDPRAGGGRFTLACGGFGPLVCRPAV